MLQHLRHIFIASLIVLIALTIIPATRAQDTAKPPAPSTTTTAPAPADPSRVSKALVHTSMGEAFFIQRNPGNQSIEWVGTLIIWLLISLSILCSTLIGTLFWSNRRRDFLSDSFTEKLKAMLYEKQWEQAARLAAGEPSMLAGVANAALRETPRGHPAMLHAAQQSADALAVRKLRAIEPLNVLGNVAPMLGLFGTVYGIILSFREIVASGGTPDPVSLAAGIGTALIATFWGLVVAIPALGAYGLLRNKIDGLTLEVERTSEDLISGFRAAA